MSSIETTLRTRKRSLQTTVRLVKMRTLIFFAVYSVFAVSQKRQLSRKLGMDNLQPLIRKQKWNPSRTKIGLALYVTFMTVYSWWPVYSAATSMAPTNHWYNLPQ
jgi:hypothetical protein